MSQILPLPGIHLTHKEVGQSSFDVVRGFKARAREGGEPKMALGHGGTLDPFAEGLLLVLAGQATRLMELLHPLPKTYEATVVWGTETDTCDGQGLPVTTADASHLTPEALELALQAFLGWQDQVPPATCAKKIDGEAAYKKAHRGEIFELKPSRVFLLEAAWLAHDLPRSSRLRITCRGGYYVRSLARDLGQALGCGAHLATLARTAIGPWRDPGQGLQQVVTGLDLLPWCRRRFLSDAEWDHLSHGRAISASDPEPAPWPLPQGFPDPGAPVAGFHAGCLVALLREAGDGWRTQANLRGGI